MNISQTSITSLIDGNAIGDCTYDFNVQMINDGLSNALTQFVFDPYDAETIQNIQNTISVELSPILLEAGVSEFSFEGCSLSDNGTLTLDMNFTPDNTLEFVPISVMLSGD